MNITPFDDPNRLFTVPSSLMYCKIKEKEYNRKIILYRAGLISPLIPGGGTCLSKIKNASKLELELLCELCASLIDCIKKIITSKDFCQAKKMCAHLGLPATPLQLRLIRIDLGTKEPEVLITSLMDTAAYPHALFKELYHDRWPIEESYKLAKSRIELENFTGKSVEAELSAMVHSMIDGAER